MSYLCLNSTLLGLIIYILIGFSSHSWAGSMHGYENELLTDSERISHQQFWQKILDIPNRVFADSATAHRPTVPAYITTLYQASNEADHKEGYSNTFSALPIEHPDHITWTVTIHNYSRY